MTKPRLGGAVVIVAVDAPDLARKLVAEGATVVITGDSDDAAGALLARLEGGPGRAAFFRHDGDVDAEALIEFVAEVVANRRPIS